MIKKKIAIEHEFEEKINKLKELTKSTIKEIEKFNEDVQKIRRMVDKIENNMSPKEKVNMWKMAVNNPNLPDEVREKAKQNLESESYRLRGVVW